MFRFVLTATLLFNAVISLETAAEESEASRAIASGLANVKEAGETWIAKRGCVSCHQVPSMVWSHQAARDAGLKVSTEDLANWSEWSTQVVNFVKPAQKDDVDVESTMDGNIDTMTHLLLAIPDDSESSWREVFASRLAGAQAEDGTWKACGQLPAQRRPKNETTATTTLWTALALSREDVGFNLDSALAFADKIEKPVSVEYLAVRLLVAAERSDNREADYRTRLLKHQNADGGWGWRLDDSSDALGTGYALYALAATGSDPSMLKSAREYLVESQSESGGWKVPGTKTSAKGKPTETANDWGSAWAVIALAASQN